ncbi:MAG: hypothetical protein MUE68_02430 [Bacteroidetes bacterium]|jgi:hypothetical protein|nr:hypothetical protein [Bacteroidota bacterium]
MSIDWKEFRRPLWVFVPIMLVIWIGGPALMDVQTQRSVLAGGTMCLLHALAGSILLDWSSGRSPISFLKRVLGGMGVRLIVMLGLVVVLLKVHAFRPTSLMLSLLGWYGVALVFEVAALQKRVKLQQE